MVISVEEKPSLQALERKTGYVETDPGKIVRAYQSTYQRPGMLHLLAALRAGTGEVKTVITQGKRGGGVLAVYGPDCGGDLARAGIARDRGRLLPAQEM
jgi:hypothetical protein